MFEKFNQKELFLFWKRTKVVRKKNGQNQNFDFSDDDIFWQKNLELAANECQRTPTSGVQFCCVHGQIGGCDGPKVMKEHIQIPNSLV